MVLLILVVLVLAALAGATAVARTGILGEFRQVVWPTSPGLVRHATVTLACLASVAGLVILLDFALSHVFSRI